MKGLKGKKLTQARLKELMSYDPNTGVFVRNVGAGPTMPGGVAGNKDTKGYLRCMLDGQEYKCHRLAWLFIHGYFPENGLDHINRVKADNRTENLREVSARCNRRNTGLPRTNTSGVKGVSWNKIRKKWRADVSVGGKTRYLGHYKSKHNAVSARLAAEQCLGWAGCDSNSPAYQYVQNMLSGALNMIKNQDPRCSGIFTPGKPETCPKRDRCLRYLHFRHLDREAGIKSYRDIGVMMASKNCDMLMERRFPQGHGAVKEGDKWRVSA